MACALATLCHVMPYQTNPYTPPRTIHDPRPCPTAQRPLNRQKHPYSLDQHKSTQAHTARQDRKRRAKPTAPEQRNSGTAAVRSRPPSTSRPPPSLQDGLRANQVQHRHKYPVRPARKDSPRCIAQRYHPPPGGQQGQHSITTNCR